MKNLQSKSDGGASVNHVIHNNAIHPRHVPGDLQIHVHLLVGQPELLGNVLLNVLANNLSGQVLILLHCRGLACCCWCYLLQGLLVSVVNHGKIQTQVVGEHDGPLRSSFIW